MIAAKSLALYKNRPVLVLERRDDKLEIRSEDGSSLRVRDKDLEALHPGPITSLPSPALGGDFETAWGVLAPADGEAGAAIPAAELAELVFGKAGPAEILAAWIEGGLGLLFRAEGALLIPLSASESAREAEKRQKKEGEAAERTSFVAKAKKARARQADAPPTSFEELDERFLLEIEALAYGKGGKNRIAADIGIAEEPEAAHAWLLAVGRWNDSVNPHPRRSGCPLASPRVPLGPDSTEVERRDLRSLESWAIDNAWSHDPDDAVAWDGEAVWVHVADPAAAIYPGSPAETEAFARGMTLYLPELTSTLLPPEALERFGLGLGTAPVGASLPESKALSFRVGLSSDGAVDSVETCVSTVSVRRASYEEADRIAASDEAGSAGLRSLAEIAELRRKRRVEAGAIEIDIPEVRVFVREGEIRIERLPETKSSGMVREMMLLAGEAAARWAFERHLPFPYYSQESPGESASVPEGLAGEFAKRRLMRAGITGPTPGAHRGLGLPFYSQATSPLRRYADLLGHMQIRAALAGREALDTDEVMRRSALAQAAGAPNRQAERASEAHWTLAWLCRHPEWQGEGCIVGSAGPGKWQVYIPSLGYETKMGIGPNHSLNELLLLKVSRIDLARLDASFQIA
ncbi:MAG: ribonuclease catalytic domain-containing protein [Spirochaetota bacterium]